MNFAQQALHKLNSHLNNIYVWCHWPDKRYGKTSKKPKKIPSAGTPELAGLEIVFRAENNWENWNNTRLRTNSGTSIFLGNSKLALPDLVIKPWDIKQRRCMTTQLLHIAAVGESQKPYEPWGPRGAFLFDSTKAPITTYCSIHTMDVCAFFFWGQGRRWRCTMGMRL